MRLDRYVGEEPKFKVLRRQQDGSYAEVSAFDYFVLALKDVNAVDALRSYAQSALETGDRDLHDDVVRLSREARDRPDRKRPD